MTKKRKQKALSQVNSVVKKILLLSHIPPRDDIPDNLIKKALEASGHLVWKQSVLSYTRGVILLLKPDIIIFPEIRCPATVDTVKLLHQWGAKIVQRRCEMGITAESEMSEELSRAMFGNWPIKDYVDLDLVWGKKFADMIVKAGAMPRGKIKLIGGIGFDQYFIPPPPIKRDKRKTVLFATGFGYADRNPVYAIPEALPEDNIHVDLVSNDRAYRDRFGNLIEAFLRLYGDEWKVLIRRHPGESWDYYKRRFENRAEDDTFGPAVASLNLCDVLIHPGSTMAYEAHLMNKPSLNFRNTNLDTLVGAIAPTYQNVGEMLDAFEEAAGLGKSNADPKIIERLNRDYYGTVDGKAHQRAADAIAKIKIGKTNYPDQWPKDEPKYLTPGVYPMVAGWRCGQCGNSYNVIDINRETVKCPYCGIANVRVARTCPICNQPQRCEKGETECSIVPNAST